jgi:dTDP-4-dehydrorhamnose reductase
VRALITGVSGMIGSNIAAVATAMQWQVTGTWHSCPVTVEGAETLRLDITDARSWRDAIERARPDVIVHNAASVELVRLQSDDRLARANVEGTINALGAAEICDARFVLVSSDWIFDGERPVGESYVEDDPPAPVNAYGRSKADSEASVSAATVDVLITRPANVYGVNLSQPANGSDLASHVLARSSLAVRWLTALSRGEEVGAPVGIYQSPTSAWSYASQLCDLIDVGATGTYHTAGPDGIHRLAYLRMLAEDFDLSPGLVAECTVSESLASTLDGASSDDLRVPNNTVLCVEKATQAVGGQLAVREGHQLMRRQLASTGVEPAYQPDQPKESVR